MNKIIGNIGEEIAKNYLVKKDYTIIARQYYSERDGGEFMDGITGIG